jgi:hypothetical protein
MPSSFDGTMLAKLLAVSCVLALAVLGDVTQGAPLLRVHSQCFTGEVQRSTWLGSRDCIPLA